MKRNHLSFFLAPRIPFAAADLVADARARTEINSHFGASAGRADARRRDEVDVGHRRGAATTPIRALRRRAPSGCGPQARWLCCSLLTYRPGYSSSLAPRQRAWGPAAKCEFISARALRTRSRKHEWFLVQEEETLLRTSVCGEGGRHSRHAFLSLQPGCPRAELPGVRFLVPGDPSPDLLCHKSQFEYCDFTSVPQPRRG